MYKNVIKRILDVIASIVILLLLLPIIFLLSILLWITNNGKPFFFQKRPGKNEKIFTIIKFKTMNDKRDAKGLLLSDDARLTAIGKFVRATSLDEIPQLFNVLKGEMSIIGPRPLLPHYLSLYNNFQRKRHLVKPGITGWAQVNGRNAISWNEKFELDVFYVNNVSFLLDVKILLITIGKVFKSEGITDTNTKTVSYFEGNENKN